MRLLGSILALLLVAGGVWAQEDAADTPPFVPQRVEITAEDGLTLVGDWYLRDGNAPTVLLLHELYTTRTSWEESIATLAGVGFNVLAVDVRGYGETRGRINWPQAVHDAGLWLNWLHDVAGVRQNGISTMGSSMGSSLAIISCAQADFCRTAVALSPGWRYYGISLADHLTAKPTLAIYAQRDRWPALGIPRMQEAAPEMLAVHALAGNKHGMKLLEAEFETLMPLVVQWLADHSG